MATIKASTTQWLYDLPGFVVNWMNRVISYQDMICKLKILTEKVSRVLEDKERIQ